MRMGTTTAIVAVGLMLSAAVSAQAGFEVYYYGGAADTTASAAGLPTDSDHAQSDDPDLLCYSEVYETYPDPPPLVAYSEARAESLLLDNGSRLRVEGDACSTLNAPYGATVGSGHAILQYTTAFLMPDYDLTAKFYLDTSGLDSTVSHSCVLTVRDVVTGYELNVWSPTGGVVEHAVYGTPGQLVRVSIYMSVHMDTEGEAYSFAGGGASGYIEIAPEPTTLCLLALGGLVPMRSGLRRRR